MMPMYELEFTAKFKKDLKKIKKQRADYGLVVSVLKTLKEKGVDGIEIRMKPHKLIGSFTEHWECHIKPDLLIIWLQIESPKIIRLIRVGSHLELFT